MHFTDVNASLCFLNLVPRPGLEPGWVAPLVFETSASTDSAIWARKSNALLRKRCKGTNKRAKNQKKSRFFMKIT